MKEASNKKILLFLIVILVFLTCCGDGQGDKIAAPGVVDGDIITVKSQAAGIVEQFLFKEGEKVEKGALIAKINSDKVENQVKELEIAKKEIEIIIDLVEDPFFKQKSWKLFLGDIKASETKQRTSP